MSKLVGTIAVAAVIGVIGLTAVGSYVSAANYGNAMEQRLEAKYQDNENVLSSGYQKLEGVAQVPAMARDDAIAIFTAAVQGRYGQNGSQAVVQMIRESNPIQDPQLYRKIQQVVESTQNEFQKSQTEMLDIKRSYQTELGTVWKGMWLKFAGYPKVDLNKYRIISTERAQDAFKTGKQAPIKLR
jgi:hypothetical protein